MGSGCKIDPARPAHYNRLNLQSEGLAVKLQAWIIPAMRKTNPCAFGGMTSKPYGKTDTSLWAGWSW